MQAATRRPAYSFLLPQPSGVTIFLRVMPKFTDIKTWTERLGNSRLRTFIDEHNHLWVEQNASKASKWAKLARKGHEIAWELDSPDRAYTGRLLIDGQVYTSAEATYKFLKD